jgi:hypothetical protein
MFSAAHFRTCQNVETDECKANKPDVLFDFCLFVVPYGNSFCEDNSNLF